MHRQITCKGRQFIHTLHGLHEYTIALPKGGSPPFAPPHWVVRLLPLASPRPLATRDQATVIALNTSHASLYARSPNETAVVPAAP